MNSRKSEVRIRQLKQSKEVRITAESKPEIHPEIIEKWQSLIDHLAKIVNVPSGLIMKLNEEAIQVFVKSNTPGNPYEEGEEAKLIYGLYCETVIGTQEKLLIPDASKDPVWSENNPDVELNMISYLGYPINWPDGEVFGTVCLLDNKENSYNELFSELVFHLKQHIESDLNVLAQNEELKAKNQELKEANKLKAKFLSLISHDLRGGIGALDEFMRLTVNRFDQFEPSKLKSIFLSLSHQVSAIYQTMENLLSWSKQDLLKMKPKPEQVDVIEIIEHLLVYFKQTALLKEIDIHTQFNVEKAHVVADKNMLETSLRNIISNALKFTKSNGHIYITVDRPNEQLILEIKDTGIGMKEDKLNKLFTIDNKPFNGTSGESSSGIGLYIVREFLDKNHASINVESKPGEGTSFQITL